MNDEIRKRAVLFDMDGVLYDSMPNHAIAWTRSMADYGLHMTKADAYATEGARGIDTIRHLVYVQQHKEISLEEAQKMYDLKTKYFHELPTAQVFPGVRELMAKIVRAGMSVNVVTGSGQRPLINRLLDDFGDYLDAEHITTAYDVEHGKPAPDPYLAGLRKAGNLRPDEAIVVENAPLGVRSGVAAGVYTVAINSGPLPDEALMREGADVLYASIRDFCNDFDRLFD
jgi:beta-phosphoglucomutase